MRLAGPFVALALLVHVAASPALGASSDPAELVLRTRLEDAARQGRWGDVVGAFLDLRGRGLATGDLRLLVRYAEAQLALKDPAAAEAALVEVLAQRPDHVVALPLLARLRAERGELAAAGDLLVLAARSGRLVLRDLASEPAGSPLRGLLGDPVFVLKVMTAAQGEELGVRPPQDPFVSALVPAAAPTVGGDERPVVEDDAELAAVRRELEALFERVLERARARDLPAVEQAFGALRATLSRLELQVGVSAALEELERARARFAEAEELFAALRLEVLLHEGNGLLAKGRAASDAGDWDAALGLVDRLDALVERLRGVGGAREARLADAFARRALELGERARTARAIAALRLEVTGIVLPPPGEPRRAIVNDRIHGEGDLVVDPASGEPVEDLRVVEIGVSVVRFRYRHTEFARALQSRR